MLDISVIVPLYNQAKLITRCVESIVNNRGGIKEIIIINNGSTDNSREVGRELERIYDNVKFYDIENANVCDARNHGIEVSTGKYYAFVDSDDTVNDEMYYLLYEDAERNKSDIVFCRWNGVSNGIVTQAIEKNLSDMVQNRNYECFLYAHKFIGGSACRAIYRREIMADVRFDNLIKFAEDEAFIIEAMSKASKMTLVEYYGYNYYDPPNFINKYYKKGCGKHLLRAMEKNNAIFEMFNKEFAEYNKFNCFYKLNEAIVYGEKYDRELLKELRSPSFKALNKAPLYNLYLTKQLGSRRWKATLYRYNCVGLVYLIVKLKAKLRNAKK